MIALILRSTGLLALLALLLVPWTAHAGDGALHWQTLRTPEADIHYPEQYQEFARKAAATLRDARRALAPVFSDRPRPRLQLTIDDYVDDANGYATPMPYDHVHVQAYPPDPLSDLGDHGDWVRALIFHEYAHILHMGDVSGLPAWGNALLGRQFLPNTALPRMLLEGLAVWVESRYTGDDVAVQGQGGRIGSAQYAGLLRAAVLDGTLPIHLSEFGGLPLVWPRGNAWYLYGSVLVDHLAQRGGPQKINDLMATIGRQVLPYGIQGLARQTWGASLERLWQDAAQQLRNQVLADVLASTGVDLARDPTRTHEAQRGDGERLTRDGHWRGRIRPHADGRSAVVAHAPLDGLVRIEQHDLANKTMRVLHTCAFDCDEPLVTPDGRWLIYVASRYMQRLYMHRELVAVPLDGVPDGARDGATDPRTPHPGLQLTRNLRGRSFALDQSGKWLTGIAIRGGRTALVALDLTDQLRRAQAGLPPGDVRWLSDFAPLGTVLDSPVMAGGWLWWTVGQGGRRTLWRAPLRQGEPVRAVGDPLVLPVDATGPWLPAHQKGQSIQPVWVGDLQPLQREGRTWLGALVQIGSRRDAAQLDLQALARGWQLRTRTLTSLYSAAHGPDRVATVRFQGGGLDVWRAPTQVVPPPAEPTSTAQVAVSEAVVPTGAPYVPAAVASTPVDYNPLLSLRPYAWRPLLLSTGDGMDWRYGGTWLGASLSGQDAAGFVGWSAAGQFRNDGTSPVLALSASVARWEPSWTLDVGFDHSKAWYRRGFYWFATPTARFGVRAGGTWTIPALRAGWTISGGFRWLHAWLREPDFDRLVPTEPGGPPPTEPRVGSELLGDWALGYGYSERYPDSIRAERVRTLTLHGTIAGRPDDGLRRITLGLDGQIAMPLGRRQVLSLAAHVVAAPLTGQADSLYSVTGILPLQALATLGLGGPTGWTVRGAPLDTGLGGQGLGWGTLAWHWPVLDVGRTLDLLPIYAGRLQGALFADGAYAFLPGGAARTGGLWSVGAELTVDFQLAYAVSGALRLGAAWLPQGGGGAWLGLGL